MVLLSNYLPKWKRRTIDRQIFKAVFYKNVAEIEHHFIVRFVKELNGIKENIMSQNIFQQRLSRQKKANFHCSFCKFFIQKKRDCTMTHLKNIEKREKSKFEPIYIQNKGR